jgi:hypothetical protein
VAFHTQGPNATDTVYLSSYLAREFGVELIRYARDVDAVTFHESGLGTVEIPDVDPVPKVVPVDPIESSLRVDLGIAQAQNALLLEALLTVQQEDGIQTHVRTKIERAIARGQS